MTNVQVESLIHPHVQSERAHLFHAENGGATEVEYLAVLTALIGCLKPLRVLETGTWTGAGTEVLYRAMVDNGFCSDLTTIDKDQACLDDAKTRLDGFGRGSRGVMTVFICGDSLAVIPTLAPGIDFAFLDSKLPVRALELRALIEGGKLSPGAVVCIHDTSVSRLDGNHRPDPETQEFYKGLNLMLEEWAGLHIIRLPLSRGMMLVQFGDLDTRPAKP